MLPRMSLPVGLRSDRNFWNSLCPLTSPGVMEWRSRKAEMACCRVSSLAWTAFTSTEGMRMDRLGGRLTFGVNIDRLIWWISSVSDSAPSSSNWTSGSKWSSDISSISTSGSGEGSIVIVFVFGSSENGSVFIKFVRAATQAEEMGSLFDFYSFT